MAQIPEAEAIVVKATVNEVQKILAESFSKEELDQLSVSNKQAARKRFGHKRSGHEIAITIVQFAFASIVGGVVYDGVKLAAIQTLQASAIKALKSRLGEDSVRTQPIQQDSGDVGTTENLSDSERTESS